MAVIYLAGLGGGLFLALFAIIVLSFIFQGLEEQVVIENRAPGFSQLAAISNGAKDILENNIVVEEFKEIFYNAAPQPAFIEPLPEPDDSEYDQAFDDVWNDFENEYGRAPNIDEFGQHLEKMIEDAEKKVLILVAEIICIDESGEYTAEEKQEMCEFIP